MKNKTAWIELDFYSLSLCLRKYNFVPYYFTFHGENRNRKKK